MALKLLHMDYLFSGPWGEEMSAEYSDLAHRIADVPGLVCKVWTENREAGEAGCICSRTRLHWTRTWEGRSSE